VLDFFAVFVIALARHSLDMASSPSVIENLAPIERLLTEETVYDLTIGEDHSFVTEAGVVHNCGDARLDLCSSTASC
jgi:hypothetical protein